jgi:hypothetical protein
MYKLAIHSFKTFKIEIIFFNILLSPKDVQSNWNCGLVCIQFSGQNDKFANIFITSTTQTMYDIIFFKFSRYDFFFFVSESAKYFFLPTPPPPPLACSQTL